MRRAARKPAAAGPLAGRLRPLVAPSGAAAGRRWRKELAGAARAAGIGAELDALLAAEKGAASLLAGAMDASPFLRALILEAPDRLLAILSEAPETRLAALCAEVGAAWRASEPELMAALRRARAEAALLVALADLGGVWGVLEVTEALTRFADAAVGAAAAFLLADAHRAGTLRLPDPERPEEGSGWILLGMGKFGAGELNYSSDIDLIVLYDLDVAPLAEGVEPAKLFVGLTKRLVRILQERDADGYVFRTDLRLRPDPGSTAIALSTRAALLYYESQGQNWERAALIKARPVGADRAAGEAFLKELVPYIWRKHLDYAAIADIHSIKRQIHDFRGHEEVAVAGHNVKLGRGGIREIEFFVQTQQLIAGGRNPALRNRRTLDTLAVLAREGWIDGGTAEALTAAYMALRAVEHRLQMVADEQTHTLPQDEDGLATVARLCGDRSAEAFAARLRPVLETVRGHYARLFENAAPLASSLGRLVFTGDDDDPETLQTLQRLGYRRPAEVTRTVRAWHFGRYPVMRSAAARERLTEFVPALIEALAGSDDADGAFAAFDRFLSRMPAGVQLFAVLAAQPGLLGLLVAMLGTAPRLADLVIRRAHVLDGILEPAFFGRLPDRRLLEERLALTLSQAGSYEDALDRARIFGQEQAFLIGVRVLAGAVGARQAGRAYADLADVLVAALFERVEAEFAGAHGRLPGGAAVVLAMGKLGGREMTAASDLDLILLYDHHAEASASDGPRPLTPSQYYIRLTQRLVAALSAPTAEGRLYDVDFRLRPSGNAGPLATSLAAFAAYQAGEAWTWERMALTRARPIAGDRGLAGAVEKQIRAALTTPRDRRQTVADIIEMRVLLEKEKPAEGAWDLKQAPGGLVDIEFVAQALQLLHAGERPELLSTHTETALAAAAEAGFLPRAEADLLLPALRLHQALTQILRLCLDGPFDPAKAPKGLLDLLARAGEVPSFPLLDAHLKATEAAVRRCFERILGKVKGRA